MYKQLWLDYKKEEISSDSVKVIKQCLTNIVLDSIDQDCVIIRSVMEELQIAVKAMFLESVKVGKYNGEPALYLKKASSLAANLKVNELTLLKGKSKALMNEAYCIQMKEKGLFVTAQSDVGILYGVYRLLALLRQGKYQVNATFTEVPSNPLRMLNHWDNMDGSIERGYSGQSFFFEKENVLVNERTKDYARLIASIGINGVVINNVNVKGAATELISTRYYQQMKELSEIFGSYGISLYLSINYAMPCEYGCGSADPLQEEVILWWKRKCAEIYSRVPLLGGFLVKADSEGRPGPFTYNRTQADGANMLAEAINPYGGKIIWRCFVYNCQQDWRDMKTDRARAGYDYFSALDGQFASNVILQIKNGPMDFQVREPVSPLFGGLSNTNQLLEVQIAQEYTGQQRHVCYLIPWFKKILAHQTYLPNCEGTTQTSVADIVTGKALGQNACGMVAVANTGNDLNWTGHDLAAANLYGFGRLAFQIELSEKEIATEWIGLTFIQTLTSGDTDENHKKVTNTIMDILMNSWPTYELYSSPLGIGWMVTPNTHYGPDVDGYEYSRWGTYHRADHLGIGIDRTPNGTGYTTQYREPNSSMYASVETCPEELILFFHHLPYTYKLKSGKTIIQHIYDTHFEGADSAKHFVEQWQKIEGLISKEQYDRVLKRLEEQSIHACEWRDVINAYFYRKSGIEDQEHRKIY